MSKKSLYERLGGYDAIFAVTNDLLDRMEKDPQLGRFWQHRGADGVKRERYDSLLTPKPGRHLIVHSQNLGFSSSHWRYQL